MRHKFRPAFDALGQDLRYSVRVLRRNPGFTAVAVLTLALGTGANSAMFAVVDAVALRPLPYPQSDRLMTLSAVHPERGTFGTSLQDYEDWRAQSKAFEEIGVYAVRGGNLTGGSEAVKIQHALVSPSLLRVLGVPPETGRPFRDEENLPGSDRVALISDGLWQRAFGGDPSIAGRTIVLNGDRLTIIGVMPAGFDFPAPSVDLWKPFGMRPDDAGDRGGRWVSAVGRLAPGVPLDRARADMDGIMAGLATKYPDTNAGFRLDVRPLLDTIVGGVRPGLFLLLGAVGVVLLIACANVANLLLRRATGRAATEIAVRSSLGATRGRIVRLLLTECVILSSLGGLGGLLLAFWGTRMLPLLAAGSLPRIDHVGIDARVFAFTAATTLLVAVLFGIAPAWRAAGVDLSGAMQTSGPRATARGGWLRQTLVVAEVALAFVVAVSAGLLMRSFAQAASVNPGFNAAGVLSLRIEPPWTVASDPAASPQEFMQALQADRLRAARFYASLIERISARPGVRGVSAINRRPLSGNAWATDLLIDGRAAAASARAPLAFVRAVMPGYFQVMGIRLVSGRALYASDSDRAPHVAIVSESLARQRWPGADPIGHRLALSPGHWYTVVGVAADVKHNTVEDAAGPLVYFALPQAPWGHFGDWGMDVVLRTAGDPIALVDDVRSVVRAAAPDLPINQVFSMEQVVARTLTGRRFNALLLGGFAAVAVMLSIVGLYGVLSNSVAERTRELGIRAALGASRGDLLEGVIGEGMRLTAFGLGIGLASSLLTTRLIASLLFAVSPIDAPTLAVVAMLLSGVSLAASLVPALRATRVEPTIALRTT